MDSSRWSTKVAAVAAVACVAACGSSSSSGSSTVSQSTLEAKLRSEPSIKALIQQGGAKAKVTSQLVGCVAKALEKDASQPDLKKYVSGKLNLNDVGGKSKGAADKASTDAKTCATNVVKQAASGVPSS